MNNLFISSDIVRQPSGLTHASIPNTGFPPTFLVVSKTVLPKLKLHPGSKTNEEPSLLSLRVEYFHQE